MPETPLGASARTRDRAGTRSPLTPRGEKMYHKTNLGRFASYVDQYADINGYVPQAGDHHSKMNYDAMTEWDADSWQEHVEAAVRATEKANQAAAEWQRRQRLNR